MPSEKPDLAAKLKDDQLPQDRINLPANVPGVAYLPTVPPDTIHSLFETY